MSKLLEMLDKFSKGPVTPIGFGPVVSQEKVPPLILVGSIGKNHVKAAQIVNRGGSDIAMIRSRTLDAPEVELVQQALGQTPWGVWIKELDGPKLESAQQAGCDFVAFEMDQAPIEVLQEGSMARVLVIPQGMDDQSLRVLEDLPVDVILLQLSLGASEIDLRQLMSISMVRGMTFKYLLLEIESLPSRKALEAVRDAGVDGLVVDVGINTGNKLSKFRKSLLELPRAKPRSDRPSPTIPRVGEGPPAMFDEEEEEEDEEF